MTVIVPATQLSPAVQGSLGGPQPSQTDLMMAAATMQDLGQTQPPVDPQAITKAHMRRKGKGR